MSSNIIHWPAEILPPQSSPFDARPFSRSGGRSLGGIARTVRTDRGFWTGSYNGIAFRHATQFEQRRVWTALRTAIGGTVGLIAVPVCATHFWASKPEFTDFSAIITEHDDDMLFDDDTGYQQDRIAIELAVAAAVGATTVTLRLVDAPTAAGIRFSHEHAMYETGRILSEPSAGLYEVEIFPAMRAPIPADIPLAADRPTVLCHLASDGEMDIEFPAAGMPRPSINFVEAVDYWNDLASGLTP